MTRKSWLAALGIILMIALLTVGILPPIGYSVPEGSSNLTIVFTHDLHSHFEALQAVNENGQFEVRGGFAGLAGIIAREKLKSSAPVLVVDGGDFSMGTLMHTLFTSEAAELRLLGQLGYDVTTIGNHEFDFDSSGLASMLKVAKSQGDPLPDIVASNISFDPEMSDISGLAAAFNSFPVKEYTVVKKGSFKIGIFGILGKDAIHDVVTAKDVLVEDQIEAADRVTKLLRDKEKVDVIVCLSHSGTNPTGDSEDEILAEKVPEIDVIISGHTHTALVQPITKGATIIGSAGCYGHSAGILQLEITKGQRPELVSYRLEPITPETPVISTVSDQIDRYKELVNQQFLAGYGLTYNQVLGESSFNLESLMTMALNPVESGLGDLITDAFRAAVSQAEGPGGDYLNVAVQPQGEIRGSLTAGTIQVDDIFEVLSLGQGQDGISGYPLVSFYLTGKEIKNCLETQSTMAPMDSKYNLQVSGIKFKYNVNRIPFDQVYDVEISTPGDKYEPMQANQLYRICASSYTSAMMSKMGSRSYGIISVTPKDKSGQALDLAQARIDADPHKPGVQELKEWQALASFIAAQPDLNGNGIPDLPQRYIKPAGRYQAVTSLAPADMFRETTFITWIVYGIVVAFAAISGLLARKFVRRIRSDRQKSRL